MNGTHYRSKLSINFAEKYSILTCVPTIGLPRSLMKEIELGITFKDFTMALIQT